MGCVIRRKRNGQFTVIDDTDTPAGPAAVIRAVLATCRLGSIDEFVIAGNPNDPRWSHALSRLRPYLAQGTYVRAASPASIAKLQDSADAMGDMTMEKQQRMQMLMMPYMQTSAMLNSILKKVSDTASSITQNLK